MPFHVPESRRIVTGSMGSDASYGNNGLFLVPVLGTMMQCIASDGMGWEHVSASPRSSKRVPTWDEMCALKAVFWDDDDAVMQLHPPRSSYVNNHSYCLHLWRPVEPQRIPLPPTMLVGDRNLGTIYGER